MDQRNFGIPLLPQKNILYGTEHTETIVSILELYIVIFVFCSSLVFKERLETKENSLDCSKRF